MIESESESDDDTSNNQSLPIFGTPSRTVSESPVHKAPSLGSLSTTPPDPVERPTRHGDSEFAIARIKIPAHGGSSKSLASLHSESSFNSSFEVVMSDLDDDDRMLYLLCARCIAFPFSAKYQLDTTPPKQKLNSAVLEKLRAALVECAELNGATKGAELTSWELKCTQSGDFTAAVRWYVANVLDNRNVRDLCGRGALSCRELSNIFEAYVKIHAERQSGKDSDMRHTLSAFTKLVESACDLPHNSYVLQTPVVSGGTLSSADQEKLYSTFQKILNISTGKHNLLYRICQLGNQDEQEAVVRKEIQKRREMLDTAAVNIGGSRQIQEMYKDAQFKILSHLTSLLDTRAFAKPPAQASVESQEPVLIKQDLKLSFKLHLTIHEVKVEAIQPDIKPVFCVFRLMNANESLTTHHEQINIQSKSARFDQIAEFTTNSPLPQIVFDFHMESKGFLRESKVIATKTYTVASMPSSDVTEWIELEEKGGAIVARLKISVFCEKPNNIKKCGYISCQGDLIFKEWRKRYFALLQLTGQYRFLLCCYKPMEAAPHKQVVLDGYSVEYLSKEEEEAHQDSDARWQFQLSSNKGTIRMGCKERSEREGWVQWMTRASGRDNKPDISGESQDLDKYTAIKDIVSADVTALDHNKMFAKMFAKTLEFQLKDPSFNRGLFSPGQLFVTDEYCSRYCVRDCTRHITCMQQWLKAEQEGMGVWPLMLYSSFRFVQMHVAGKKPNDRSVFVVEEDRDALLDISHQIAELSASKVEGFRYCFPFGQPKDDLKVNIKLLSIVSYMQPGLSERGVADNKVLVVCMEKAALANYQDVYQRFVSEHSKEVSLEEYVPLSPPLMQALIQRCIDYMYELHDFYLDEFVECPSVLGDHIEAFWSFLLVDLQEALNVCDDVISKIQLFYVINQYFCSQPTLKLCKFHSNVLDLFGPVVEEYIDSIGGSLMADLKTALDGENWLPSQQSGCCGSVDGWLQALTSLDSFVAKLAWPVESFSLGLQEKVFGIYCEQLLSAAKYIHERLNTSLSPLTVNTLLPLEVICLLNTLLHLKAQMLTKYSFRQRPLEMTTDQQQQPDALSEISEILLSAKTFIIEKVSAPLITFLEQLSLHDPSESFFARLKLLMPGKTTWQDYKVYFNQTFHVFSENLVQDDFNSILVDWYDFQFQHIHSWLSTRPPFSLQSVQMESISQLTEALRESFENSTSILKGQLDSDAYNSTQDRMRMEQSRLQLISST